MAKHKYDIELFIKDIEGIFKTNLNTKITAVNLEKQTLTDEVDDNFDIDQIDSEAWYFGQLPAVWSYTNFVVYGLENITLEGEQYDGHIQKVSMFIEVLIDDDGSVPNESQIYKLLRYTRCLQEVALENFDSIRSYGKLTVNSLPPTLIEIDGRKLKSSGINISALFDI